MESTAASGRADPQATAARRRIVLEDLAPDAPEELPDVAREIRTLRRILDLNKRLARIDEEPAFLDAFLDGAVALLGSERAFLLAPDGVGSFRVVRARDLSGEAPAPDDVVAAAAMSALVRRESSALSDPADGAAGTHGAGDDGAADRAADRADGGAARESRSVVCVPLPGPEPRALYLDSRRERDLFAAADRELLTLFAEQASVGLERVRLAGQNRRQRDELIVAARNSESLNRRLAELLERRTAELRDVREDLQRAGVDDAFRHRYPEIVGRGPAMSATLRLLDRVADTDVPVLFEGESGTGKELLARALHAGSRRSTARFVAENCAALPETLLENELFGHERGAFTGADAAAAGLFERADGGSLFLDEVGDTSPGLQKRLLRVLQEGEVRRVGGSSVRKVDVRVVTATNRDLRTLVEEGRFREDLYYRLAVVKIRVPPLRERPEDVPALVAHFLVRACPEGEVVRIEDAAMDALISYAWPGNVRQLENEIRRAVALGRGGVIERSALSREVLEPRAEAGTASAGSLLPPGRSLRDVVEELEVRVLREILERERGNITHAAAALGLSRLGLRKKMRRYGLSRDAVEG